MDNPIMSAQNVASGYGNSIDWSSDGLASMYSKSQKAKAFNDPEYALEMHKLGIENQFNAEQAQLNREWQEMMSNTSYQRGKEDMIKAGLNPYLALTNGGASTPSGATAHSGSGNVSAKPITRDRKNIANALGAFGHILSSAIGGYTRAISAEAQLNSAITHADAMRDVAYIYTHGRRYHR